MVHEGHVCRPTAEGLFIKSTYDALVLLETVLSSSLNHVARRPHDGERRDLIKSGNVFIYEENASGITRWTDGVTWSPSRIKGNFLIYREVTQPFPPGEKKRAIKKDRKPSIGGITKNPSPPSSTSSRVFRTGSVSGSAEHLNCSEAERDLVGSLIDSYPFKENGLVKKTISIKVRGVTHHLVSYYTIADVMNGNLRIPSELDEFKFLPIRNDLVTGQNFRMNLSEEFNTMLQAKESIPQAAHDAVRFITNQPFQYEANMMAQQTMAYHQPVQHSSPSFLGYNAQLEYTQPTASLYSQPQYSADEYTQKDAEYSHTPLEYPQAYAAPATQAYASTTHTYTPAEYPQTYTTEEYATGDCSPIPSSYPALNSQYGQPTSQYGAATVKNEPEEYAHPDGMFYFPTEDPPSDR